MNQKWNRRNLFPESAGYRQRPNFPHVNVLYFKTMHLSIAINDITQQNKRKPVKDASFSGYRSRTQTRSAVSRIYGACFHRNGRYGKNVYGALLRVIKRLTDFALRDISMLNRLDKDLRTSANWIIPILKNHQ